MSATLRPPTVAEMNALIERINNANAQIADKQASADDAVKSNGQEAKFSETAPNAPEATSDEVAEVSEETRSVVPPSRAAAIATKFVQAGAHVIFFPRGTKRCTTPGWEQKATNNLEAALAWAGRDPSANVGIVGKQDGLWGLDDDAGLLAEYEAQYGPIQTYATHTVSGGRHFIFRQNGASWAMGNVSIHDDQKRELLSARVDNRYVVAAGSWAYPNNDITKSLTQYVAIDPNAPFVEAPASLLAFIKDKESQWKAKVRDGKPTSQPQQEIHEGGRNNHLAQRAGALRNIGASYETILHDLTERNERDCKPPLDESEVESIAKSYSKYDEGKPHNLVFTQTDPAVAAEEAAKKAAREAALEAALKAQAEAITQLDAWLSDNSEIVMTKEQVVPLIGALSELEYEVRRKKIAKKLGIVRPKVLDDARAQFVPEKEEEDDSLQGQAVVIEDIAPWHEPVDIAAVLDEIENTFRRFIFFWREEDAISATLWCAMTWLTDYLSIAPYLGVRSPEKECGKSTLLKIISKLVYHPMPASNVTSASVFRLLDMYRLTLLIDELDTFLELDPQFVGIMNSGHSRELGRVVRTVGEDLEPRWFNTFGPKAYGMIGGATDTLESRSLSIILYPKVEEDGIEDLDFKKSPELIEQMNVLARKLARWVQDHGKAVAAFSPQMKGITNRKKNNWEPLFQIAQFAGPVWAAKARKAAGIVDPTEQENVNRVFIKDVRNIFHTRKTDFMPSDVLLSDLRAQEESGWDHYGKSRDGMTAKDLSDLMKVYGVESKRGRIDGVQYRGYHLSQFDAIFTRFLSKSAPEDVELGKMAVKGLGDEAGNGQPVTFRFAGQSD